jgi:hypothetical protein
MVNVLQGVAMAAGLIGLWLCLMYEPKNERKNK